MSDPEKPFLGFRWNFIFTSLTLNIVCKRTEHSGLRLVLFLSSLSFPYQIWAALLLPLVLAFGRREIGPH